jgi:type II secretory pathway component PulK
MMPAKHRQSGVVLAMVLILALVLSAAVVTFTRRAVIDRMIVRNRDQTASAEALARGGVEIGMAIAAGEVLGKVAKLVGDELPDVSIGNSADDLTRRAASYELVTAEGAVLTLEITSAGSRLNLNTLMVRNKQSNERVAHPSAEEFLVEIFDKVIQEIDAPPEDTFYDPRELAQNLLDYLDSDDLRIGGGDEDSYYQGQSPPYRAANGPLLSVRELALVEGFDAVLTDAMQPYVTVYPYVGGAGVDINSAPPHVLAVTAHGTGANQRLLNEEDIRRILGVREEGSLFCDSTEQDPDRCRTLAQADLEGELFPPVKLPVVSRTYSVVSRARVGEIEKVAEAIVSLETLKEPRLLSWRLR